MLHIGCHLSPSAGLARMAENAVSIGADTFQFFARNPRGSKAKAIDPADAAAMASRLRENGFAPVLVHAPYTLNPCSADPKVVEFAHMAMADDLNRLALMGVDLYNLHPGSHVGQGTDVGVEKTAALLNALLTESFSGVVLLETMAGQGSEIGGTFEQIRAIIDRVERKDRLGVCLDTCHVFAAGYDIAADPDAVLTEFDRVIGLERLRYVHLNDSMFGCGNHKDRHAAIGAGMIGCEGIRRIVKHPALRSLPFCLETPHESLAEYAEEIALVRRLADED
ncbi:MAG: deoxyribonuclease IV [Clostridia bacterium]|nr:deoxyribonuclease IV [Clostridia bacterium]